MLVTSSLAGDANVQVIVKVNPDDIKGEGNDQRGGGGNQDHGGDEDGDP